MHDEFDVLARDVATLSRRQVLRRLATGAGLTLVALVSGRQTMRTAWAAGTCAGTVCGQDCCTAEETCSNNACVPRNSTCSGPGETACGPDCCTSSEKCVNGKCVPR